MLRSDGRIMSMPLDIIEETQPSWVSLFRSGSQTFRSGFRKIMLAFNTKRKAERSSRSRSSKRGAADERNRFQVMVQRINSHPDYRPSKSNQTPYGTFAGRHIIGEHTGINGGIYIGVVAHEAVVVDEKYGSLEELYNEFMLRYVRRHGTTKQAAMDHALMREIVSFVKEKLRLVPEPEIVLLARREGFRPDQKVALDIYLEYGIGTDRHQMLMAAYLLEKLQQKQMIKGKIYIDSTYRENSPTCERLIFSSVHGYLFVFSPAAH